jgi:hypothetical protein
MLKSTLPTAENRPFNPGTDLGVIRRGGNVTTMTMFGGLDVIQRCLRRLRRLRAPASCSLRRCRFR